ncbi:low molecular weight phosphatase family protein [Polaribacter dokdonensis]|uniref:Arsenate reductase n=1 Tax=Polaribacter dokdonensis DSW-5 TaxID=1300348 RepID=A0A0N0UN75_9FLAO|nr:protein-tyrosine-phosphatase [Polaribacter dokdonensis]KOY50824.1 Low molecular weight phosphatase family protein [Polaribacter dokdonensis DSW-5]SEE25220.1 arsenate reductase [Polaribacter dokdonensis DSW-5]
MNAKIEELIKNLNIDDISAERKKVLQPLTDFIAQKKSSNKLIRINFICTHNSRRSHLGQIWAQTMAAFFDVKNVVTYSGGTETTAMFPKVGETLANQGFKIQKLSETNNPVYAIKFDENSNPIIAFSKKYSDDFNPKSNFAAIMTCSHADGNCPFIAGAEKRIPITYDDPKLFDNTEQQNKKYEDRSLQIATEMKYIFANI